tara:strand:+ start:48 stop:965 length:918 start_codon:yes stop_codon:yes gene_type:complete
MPPKMKVPDGEMNATELRKLIRAHNILVTIKIPKGTDRLGLIKLIEGKGYKVDHKKKAIIDSKADRPRRPQVTLKNAIELTKPKPVSEEEKKKRQQARQKKKGEKAFLKVAIPKAPPVSKKPSKVIKVGKPPPKPKKVAPVKKTPVKKATTKDTEKALDKATSKIVVPKNSSIVKILTIGAKNTKLFTTKANDSTVLKDWINMTRDINKQRLSLMIKVDKDQLDKDINNFDDVKKLMGELNQLQKPLTELMRKSKKLLDKLDVNDKTIKPKILFSAKVKKQFEEDMDDVRDNIQTIIRKKQIKPS